MQTEAGGSRACCRGACCQEPSSVVCLCQRFLAVAAVELREVDRHLRGGLRLFLLGKGHGWPKR
ncbi:hypothetical protein NH935_04085 [Collinsella aerofaciens]|uniref:hypothetical protein n=1 Tax=Collinsella aerofaciens TaxID=74426 RepID=UPI002098506C|nr:hypothetical protein [Collinsella aerofaciens]MCO7115753.1 hypothetical protein [Collinsella aerofaciens]MDB1858901.1 hypothetical protein [Collinsella aerofaciens]